MKRIAEAILLSENNAITGSGTISAFLFYRGNIEIRSTSAKIIETA
ncbi:hypothetical protein NAC44_07280 [Allorhizobium sp. BGMRC 0089]|nr:hypothetical protein [Allorhizobium sonneratiae]MCM2292133.1 hypothetical protein [Allorhizobium sonneratiae]